MGLIQQTAPSRPSTSRDPRLRRRPWRGRRRRLGLPAGRDLADGRELPGQRRGDQCVRAPERLRAAAWSTPASITTSAPRAGLIDRKVGSGTRNFAIEPAMSAAQCAQALEHGMALAREPAGQCGRLRRNGHREHHRRRRADAQADRHAGGRMRRRRHRPVTLTASRHKAARDRGRPSRITPACTEPLDVLATFGGFEIAMMAGAMLRAAERAQGAADRRLHRHQRAAGRRAPAAGHPRLLRVRALLGRTGPPRMLRAARRQPAARPGPAPGRRHRLRAGLAAAARRGQLPERDGDFRIGPGLERTTRPSTRTPMHQLRLFFIALQFFTRLPIPRWVGFEPAWLQSRVALFPAGRRGGGRRRPRPCTALPPHCCPRRWPRVLSTAAGIYLTGAFHEDGFADTCDGFGGGMTQERVLEIMKDSRIGAYGAIGIVLHAGAQSAPRWPRCRRSARWRRLLLAHPLSRLCRHGPDLAAWTTRAREGKAKPLAQRMSGSGIRHRRAHARCCQRSAAGHRRCSTWPRCWRGAVRGLLATRLAGPQIRAPHRRLHGRLPGRRAAVGAKWRSISCVLAASAAARWH